MENSFVWQCLKKLPEDGWSDSTSSSTEPWDKVGERLRELAKKLDQPAKKLDQPNEGSPAAPVGFVHTVISKWATERDARKKKEQQEISQRKAQQAQLRKNIDIIEEELKRLHQGEKTLDREYDKLDNEAKKLPKEKRGEYHEALAQRSKWLDKIRTEIKAKEAEKKELEEKLKGLEKEAKQPPIDSSVEKVNDLWHRLVRGASLNSTIAR
jgi:chromosome segregation ATPase